MDFQAKQTDIGKFKTQCAIVFAQGNSLLSPAAEIDNELDGLLTQAIKTGDLEIKSGKSLWIPVPQDAKKSAKNKTYERVLVLQLGGSDDNSGETKKSKSKKSLSITSKSLRKVFATCARALESRPIKDCAVYIDGIQLTDIHNETANAETIGHLLAIELERSAYRYVTTLSKKELPKLEKVTLASANTEHVKAAKEGLRQGKAFADGINLTRELGNLPGNICTPSYLADQAKALAETSDLLTTKVLGEKQMEKLKMGSLLSVAHGSDEEAKLIIMEYNNGPKSTKPHVLVGKGITFDTGGISIKPGIQMDEMKFDMCGAASVFGTIKTLIELQAKVNVIGIVAAAENMPSGRATKPGDIVTSMSGQTIEILNTDAEGRLVLCDALTYAERFNPKTVIDIATLTGACVIALGNHASGLYANDDTLANNLLASGEATDDRAWHMPLWDEYQKALDSNFADMANVGGREAGSITAACFLSRYTKKYKWAHLDIAGTAWNGGAKKGATGRPVSLLVHYLLNN